MENNTVLVSTVDVSLVPASGTLTLYLAGSSVGWTNAGTKGFGAVAGLAFSYILN